MDHDDEHQRGACGSPLRGIWAPAAAFLSAVALYLRAWNTLRESAVFGADAHRLIHEARQALIG